MKRVNSAWVTSQVALHWPGLVTKLKVLTNQTPQGHNLIQFLAFLLDSLMFKKYLFNPVIEFNWVLFCF